MLKIGDDIKSVIRLLLDLVAALDTVDFTLFIAQIGKSFWRKGQCSLLVSFISSVFFVNGTESSLKCLQNGAPQGSVLGPLLYSGREIEPGQHYIPFHLYADDTQLYLPFIFNCPNHIISSKKPLVEKRVQDIGNQFKILVHDLPPITSKQETMLPFQVNLPGIQNLVSVSILILVSTLKHDVPEHVYLPLHYS